MLGEGDRRHRGGQDGGVCFVGPTASRSSGSRSWIHTPGVGEGEQPLDGDIGSSGLTVLGRDDSKRAPRSEP
jgi:hypothetical protein